MPRDARTHALTASEGVPPVQTKMPLADGAVASLPPGVQRNVGGSPSGERPRLRMGGRLAQARADADRENAPKLEPEAVDLAAVAALGAAPMPERESSRASATMALQSLREPEPEPEEPGHAGEWKDTRSPPAAPRARGVSFDVPEPELAELAGPRTPPGRSTGIAEATERGAARTWLQDHGFSEAEAEEFEATTSDSEEFSAAALERIGVPELRERLRQRADTSGTASRREARPPAAKSGICGSSPPRRQPNPTESTPPSPRLCVSEGMFILLHKNEGKSAPHKRWFKFDSSTKIVRWSKTAAKSDTTNAKYGVVISAKADIPIVRHNRSVDPSDDMPLRSLRLQTQFHGTLNLELTNRQDASMWLDVIGSTGVHAEALSKQDRRDYQASSSSADDHDRNGQRSVRKSKGKFKESRSSSPIQDEMDDEIIGGANDADTSYDENMIDTDHDVSGSDDVIGSGDGAGEGQESGSGNTLLTVDEWDIAIASFESLANRNVSGLNSEYERIAVERMQKFQSMGRAAEIQLLENLVRRERADD